MTADPPYASMVEDAARGMRVLAFCDSMAQLERARRGIAAKARAMGHEHVVARRTRNVVEIGRGEVRLAVAGQYAFRGTKGDVAYLSESATRQMETAAMCGALVR